MCTPRLVIKVSEYDDEDLGRLLRIGCHIHKGNTDDTCEVAVPYGWKHVISDEPLNDNCIVDTKGNCRITVAGDVSDSYINPVLLAVRCRYWATIGGDHGEHKGLVYDLTQGLGQPIYRTKAYQYYGDMDGRTETNWREQYAAAGKDAFSWLDEHYPEWRDPAAYWD